MNRSIHLIGLLLAVVFVSACSNESPQSGADAGPVHGLNDSFELEPGESKTVRVESSSAMDIGVKCHNTPEGGVIRVEQAGTEDFTETRGAAANTWQATGGVITLRVSNHAKNRVTVSCYEGILPP